MDDEFINLEKRKQRGHIAKRHVRCQAKRLQGVKIRFYYYKWYYTDKKNLFLRIVIGEVIRKKLFLDQGDKVIVNYNEPKGIINLKKTHKNNEKAYTFSMNGNLKKYCSLRMRIRWLRPIPNKKAAEKMCFVDHEIKGKTLFIYLNKLRNFDVFIDSRDDVYYERT